MGSGHDSVRLACFAVAVLGAAFAVHLALWRARLPRSQTKALLLVFTGALIAGFAVAAMVPALRSFLPRTPWEVLLVATFHITLSLAYTAFYSAIEEDSPSCQIVKIAAAAGETGIRQEAFERLISNESLLLQRLQVMVRGGLAEERGGVLRLTSKGRILARIFSVTEILFGLPRGG